MLHSLLIHDNKKFKNKTLLHFGAMDNSTRKDYVFDLSQKLDSVNNCSLLKALAIYGDDDCAKDLIVDTLQHVLTTSQDNLHIERGTYIEIWYFAIHAEYKSLLPYSIQIYFDYEGKSYIDHFFTDKNGEDVLISQYKPDKNSGGIYPFQKYREWICANCNMPKICFFETNKNKNIFTPTMEKGKKLDLLSALTLLLRKELKEVVNIHFHSDGSFFITYKDENENVKTKSSHSFHKNITDVILFLCKFYTSSDTLFVVKNLLDVIQARTAIWIIDTFLDYRNNDYGNQLLFTSNRIELIGEKNLNYNLRADQIYLTNTNPDDLVDLYTIGDFDTSQFKDLAGAFYIGRFGATPIV